MKKFNLEKLVNVKVHDFQRSAIFFYLDHKPKKYFWQESIEEGIYINNIVFNTKLNGVPAGYVLKDKTVYEKPEVIMSFSDGKNVSKYFDSLSEAQEYADNITKGKDWLTY